MYATCDGRKNAPNPPLSPIARRLVERYEFNDRVTAACARGNESPLTWLKVDGRSSVEQNASDSALIGTCPHGRPSVLSELNAWI